MDEISTRIGPVSYDVRTRLYSADVTWSDARGLTTVHVRTPGRPDWGHARTLEALAAAGACARAARGR